MGGVSLTGSMEAVSLACSEMDELLSMQSSILDWYLGFTFVVSVVLVSSRISAILFLHVSCDSSMYSR